MFHGKTYYTKRSCGDFGNQYFQSGTEQGLHRNEQPPPTQQGAFPKGKGAVVANAVTPRRLGLSPLPLRSQSVCPYRSYRQGARRAAAACSSPAAFPKGTGLRIYCSGA